jgi:nucleotide-binding universal stress UspA family protein
MKLKSILFPTDFSHYNDAALEYASTLAAEANAKLYIVHVHDMSEMSASLGEVGFIYEDQWKEEELASREHLSKVTPTVSSVRYERYHLVGITVTAIIDFAGENDIDLIVMASHGRTGISRMLMGSIAEGVLRRAMCPVLVVKQPAGKAEDSSEAAEHASGMHAAKA